jgi:putative transposase
MTMKGRRNPDAHHRRSIRLAAYDYHAPGAYFVTLCTQGRECVLDDPVVTGIITGVWRALPRWFPTIVLDEFVVMPSHVHMIVWLQPVGATLAVAPDAVAPDAVAPDAVAPDAVAPDAVAPDAVAPGTGASPAPTGGVALDVEATLAVVPGAGASPAPTDGAATAPSWNIPAPETPNLNPTLGDVIGAFKSLVFTVYLDWVQAHDPTRRAKFWQRNYYEHIIRNEEELHAIRRYIRNNPARWALDRDNPDNLCRLTSPAQVEDYLADVQAAEAGHEV